MGHSSRLLHVFVTYCHLKLPDPIFPLPQYSVCWTWLGDSVLQATDVEKGELKVMGWHTKVVLIVAISFTVLLALVGIYFSRKYYKAGDEPKSPTTDAQDPGLEAAMAARRASVSTVDAHSQSHSVTMRRQSTCTEEKMMTARRPSSHIEENPLNRPGSAVKAENLETA